MAAISTIANGANPRALYNQIVTALSTCLGITDSLQTYALAAKLEVALSTVIIDKDGSDNMTFDDPNVAVQTLKDLLGAVVSTTFLGYPGRARNLHITMTANLMYLIPVRPHAALTATGLYMTAASAGATTIIHAGLFDNLGVKLAGSTTPVTIGLDQGKTVSFASSYEMVPGNDYWAGVVAKSTGGNQLMGRHKPWIARSYAVGSHMIPDTITTPTSLSQADGPSFYVVVSGGIL